MHHRTRRSRHLAFVARGEIGEIRAEEALARAVADWSSAIVECRRLACRRARRCCGRGVPCLEHQEEAIARCLVEHPRVRHLVDVALEIEENEAGYA